MWTREELKTRGKAAFKANYWRSVAVALILFFVTGSAAAGRANRYGEQSGGGSSLYGGFSMQTLILGASVASAILIIGLVIRIFVLLPLEAGGRHFFSENSRSKAGFGELGKPFSGRYMHVVGTLLLRDIFVGLWSLLFVIPGIIKFWSYRMVPYLAIDYPELSARQTITLSRKMMDGEKARVVFDLYLSFILWFLLSAFTMGIVWVFYVNPYLAATDAELYHRLSEKIPDILPEILGEGVRKKETSDHSDNA